MLIYSIELLWDNNVSSFVPDHNSNNDHWGNTYDGEEITTDLQPGVIRFERNNPDFEGGTVNYSRNESPAENTSEVNYNVQYRYFDMNGNPVSHPIGISIGNCNNKAVIAQ